MKNIDYSIENLIYKLQLIIIMNFNALRKEFEKLREELREKERKAYIESLKLDPNRVAKIEREIREQLPLRADNVVFATTVFLLLKERDPSVSQRKVSLLFDVTDVAIRNILAELRKKGIKQID